MKITGIRSQLFEIELSRPLGDANSPQGRTRAAALAVFVDSDRDLTGLCFAGPAAAAAIEGCRPLLMGEDPRRVRGLWQRMVDRAFKGGVTGSVAEAIGCLDVALWDLKARAAGEPLWRVLGAASGRVPVYASGIEMPLDDAQVREFYQGMAARGVWAGKLKVGLEPAADLRRLRIMHDALATSGKTPLLAVDANEYWSPKQAIRRVGALEQHFDLAWCEEPARRWDYRGLRRVSRGVKAAVATGENLTSIGEFMPLVANEAVDIVQVGVRACGITGAMQIAHLAHGFELPVAMMNCPGDFMAHLAAALPNHLMMEVVDAGWEQVIRTGAVLQQGCLVLDESPGLGLDVDEHALARCAVEKPSADAGPSPRGRRRGAGLYEVGPDED